MVTYVQYLVNPNDTMDDNMYKMETVRSTGYWVQKHCMTYEQRFQWRNINGFLILSEYYWQKNDNLYKIVTFLMTNNFSEQAMADSEHSVTSNETIHESLLSSEIASFFLIFNAGLLIPSTYLHFLIHRMVSREKKKVGETLHGRALTIYAKLVVFAQFWIIINVNGIMSYTYPAFDVIGSWYCYLVEVVLSYIAVYIGSFSLLIAAMKYWFIVHNAKAQKVGIDRSLTISITIHLSMSVILPLLNAVSNGDMDSRYWVNKCWGHDIRNSNATNGFWNTLGKVFCYFRDYHLDYYIGKQASEYLEPCLRVLCGGLVFLFTLMLLNLIELVLYALLLKHIDRYVRLAHST